MSSVIFIQYLFGLSVVRGIKKTRECEDLDVCLKWPNDIYAKTKDGLKKIGGILITSEFFQKSFALTVGCGLNVLNSKPSVCLQDLTLNKIEMEMILASILSEFELLYTELLGYIGIEDVFGPFRERYYKYWLHTNQLVNVEDAEGKITECTIRGLDESGFLKAKTNQGAIISLQPDGNSFDMLKGLIYVKNANQLIKQKEHIESQIQEFEAILRSHKVGMKTPLVDSEGFPRADVDVYAIRQARSQLARLYNDQEKIINDIQEALTKVHSAAKTEQPMALQVEKPVAFAKINGVAPDSPANIAGLLRGDLITEFGKVNIDSPDPLTLIAKELPSQLNQPVRIRLVREGVEKSVFVTPAPWEGKGLLAASTESSDSTETQKAEPTSWNLSWSGIINAVKQTSEQVGQVLKEDLTELAGDIKNLADAGQTLAKDLLQDSETSDDKNESVVNTIDEYAEKAEQLAFEGITNVDRMESMKLQVGLDENTYLKDPLETPDLAERFSEFQKDFDQIAHAGKIGGIVSQQPEIKKLMAELVPRKIKDEDFWLRYFFQISELERQQAARELLMSGDINQAAADDDVAWSSDEDTPHQSIQMESIVPQEQAEPQPEPQPEHEIPPEVTEESKSEAVSPATEESKSEAVSPSDSDKIQVKTKVSKVQEKDLTISRDDQSGSSYDMVEAKESSTDFGVESVTDAKEDWDGWD
ncbi:hypothetical protein HDV01_000453 [Terramyces sp. JEL0728]|nr:hypothetical protein HDV01_000453 [Terramyces sp. JEL0728]